MWLFSHQVFTSGEILAGQETISSWLLPQVHPQPTPGRSWLAGWLMDCLYQLQTCWLGGICPSPAGALLGNKTSKIVTPMLMSHTTRWLCSSQLWVWSMLPFNTKLNNKVPAVVGRAGWSLDDLVTVHGCTRWDDEGLVWSNVTLTDGSATTATNGPRKCPGLEPVLMFSTSWRSARGCHYYYVSETQLWRLGNVTINWEIANWSQLELGSTFQCLARFVVSRSTSLHGEQTRLIHWNDCDDHRPPRVTTHHKCDDLNNWSE